MPDDNENIQFSNWQLLLESLTERTHIPENLGENIQNDLNYLLGSLELKKILTLFLDEYKKTTKNKSNASNVAKDLQSKFNRSRANFSPPVLDSTQKFPNASTSVHVAWTKEKGRHVICSKAVMKGDLLFVEAPKAAIINRDFQTKFCQQCCIRVFEPKPCTSCSEVVFCSIKCRDISWKEQHHMECGYQDFFNSIGVAHLALRCLFSAGSFEQLMLELKHCQEMEGKEQRVGKGRYQSLYNLQYHSNLDPKEFFQYALTAILLVHFLSLKTSYFPKDGLPKNMLIVSKLLLIHILQLIVNAHAVVYSCLQPNSQSIMPGTNIHEVTSQRIATGIYPSSAMMNHSCDPSVVNSFYGNVLAVRAAKDLSAGEEVFNCYGPHHRRMVRSERQKVLLDQYRFTCCCTPCSLPYDIMEIYSAYRCPICSGPLVENRSVFHPGICRSCGNENEIGPIMFAKCHDATEVLEKAKVDPTLPLSLVIWGWRTARTALYHSNKVTVQLADEIAYRLALQGQFKLSFRVQKACLLPVLKRFGDPSPALASEVAKLGKTAMLAAQQLNVNNPLAKELRDEGTEFLKQAEAQSLILYGQSDLPDDVLL